MREWAVFSFVPSFPPSLDFCAVTHPSMPIEQKGQDNTSQSEDGELVQYIRYRTLVVDCAPEIPSEACEASRSDLIAFTGQQKFANLPVVCDLCINEASGQLVPDQHTEEGLAEIGEVTRADLTEDYSLYVDFDIEASNELAKRVCEAKQNGQIFGISLVVETLEDGTRAPYGILITHRTP